MRFFVLDPRARLVDAMNTTSLDDKLRRAIPTRRGRFDAKRCAASAIERVEFLRGMRGGEGRKRDFGLHELSLAIFCQSLVPLAEFACEIGRERPAEWLIDGHRIRLALDEYAIELAANHFRNGAPSVLADNQRHPVFLRQAFEPGSEIDRVAKHRVRLSEF